MQSGIVVELCVERGRAIVSPLDHASVGESDEPPALPPIDDEHGARATVS